MPADVPSVTPVSSRQRRWLDQFPDDAEKLQLGMGFIFDMLRDGADAFGVVLRKGAGAVSSVAGAYIAWRLAASAELEAVHMLAGTGLGSAAGFAGGSALRQFAIRRSDNRRAARERQEDLSREHD